MKKYIIITFVVCLIASPALAQGLGINKLTSKMPVTIEAEKGIEWIQASKVYIAHGNATAVRGAFSVRADTLKAFYRGEDDTNDIYKLEAIGQVYIKSGQQVGYADFGEYLVEKGTMRLTGNTLKLVSGHDTLTAKDYIEYHEKEGKAYAKGNATVTRDNNKLTADTLTAIFEKNAAGQQAVKKIFADGHVVIITPDEKVTSDKGTYSIKSGEAILTGNVHIFREQNTLKGDRAVVNLNTGVSRLLTSAGVSGQPTRRVRGVFTPKKKGKKGSKGF